MSSADERGKLYQSAMEAWRRGETTTALSKLDQLLEIEIQDPDQNPKSVESLRSLHEQVKADQAALKDAYNEARQLLADGSSEEALSICEAQLARYPEHPLFESLKLDVEAHRRRRISSYIAEVDESVEREPDLARRVEILEAAATRYPDEQHFQTALGLVREKLDLVGNIVADAQLFEKDHKYAEALEQWQTLATIHPDHPGLEGEIERVNQLREQYGKVEARRRSIDRVQALIAEGQWEKAVEAVRDAASRFPDDEEIAELEAETQRRASRSTEARKLFDQGCIAYEERRFEEGLRHLRNAQQLEPGNVEFREALLAKLLVRAGSEMDSDWRAAERLLKEALELDPANAEADRLVSAVESAREAEHVSWYLVRARRYRSDGREDEARKTIEEGLSKYPDNRDLMDMFAGQPRPAETAPVEEPPPTREIHPSEVAPEIVETREVLPSETELPPAPTPTPAPQPAMRRRSLWVAIALVALVVVAGLAAAWVLSSRNASAPGEISISVRTTPPGARIAVDGDHRGESDLDLPLKPGTYVLEAHLDGYLPLRSTIDVNPDNGGAVSLTLEPLPVRLRIFSDLGDGAEILLDEEPVTASGDEIVVDNLQPGEHTLSVSSRFSRASLTFAVQPGEPPRLTAPVEARQSVVVAVGQFANQANAYCSCAPVPLLVDDEFAGKLEPRGLPLQELSYGLHEFTLGDSDDSRQVALDTGPAPSLSVFLQSDRDVGTLVVVAGEEDGATVVLNGRVYRRLTSSGRLRIPGVLAREHRVAVRKDGFKPAAEQTVAVRKGRVTTVRFDLEPIPERKKLARLFIRDALGGATLTVDGQRRATVPEHGSISLDLEPGEHTIELSKQTFRPRKIVRTFREGESVQLGLRDVALEQILGTLRISVTPADADLHLRRLAPVQDAARPAMPGAIRLAPGTYEVSGSLDGHAPFSKTIVVPSGETVDVAVKLESTAPLPPPEPTMAGWDEPGTWSRQGDAFVRRGGEYVTYGTSPVDGLIEFTVHLRRGRRLRWFTTFEGEQNHALFEIDGSSFIRNIVRAGREEQLAKVAHHRIRDDVYNLRLRISQHTIVHELRRGDEWITIDTWDDPGQDFRKGKFGFFVRGRNEIALQDFTFTPR